MGEEKTENSEKECGYLGTPHKLIIAITLPSRSKRYYKCKHYSNYRNNYGRGTKGGKSCRMNLCA